MAKNYLDRYIWLIDTIGRHGYIKFEDISRKWAFSHVNTKGESKLPERTFFNHVEAILDTFGIEIKCDRAKGYYIVNGDEMEDDGIRRWLLESLSLSSMLNESRDLRDRILFERIPSSKQWLPLILNAMRDGKAIEMTYQSFSSESPASFTAHPWCLKVFRQRWYVLALSEGFDHPRVYALDRILDLRESEIKLKMKKGFDAASFFHDFFGIYVEEGRKPKRVEIRVEASQAKYFESLPLHDSQEIVSRDGDYSVFRYRLVPTYDFRQEILRQGPTVEVLAPEWFRKEVMDDIAKMASRYCMPE